MGWLETGKSDRARGLLGPRLGFFGGGDDSFVKEFFSLISAVANYSLPEKNDYLDEVIYGELTKEEAQPLVTKYKEEARKLLPPSEKRANRRNNRNKRNRQNRNRGQGYGEAPAGRRGGGQIPAGVWHVPSTPGIFLLAQIPMVTAVLFPKTDLERCDYASLEIFPFVGGYPKRWRRLDPSVWFDFSLFFPPWQSAGSAEVTTIESTASSSTGDSLETAG